MISEQDLQGPDRCNIEVYVDDMLIKNCISQSHVKDLDETFTTLHRHKIKLNPAKCAFEVASRKFLGFMMSDREIEASREKILALTQMTAPKTIKENQMLTGRIAAFSRFVSRSTKRCLPLFQILKKPKNFEWIKKCQKAFKELKSYLDISPLLSKPKVSKELYLYLIVSPAIGSILI